MNYPKNRHSRNAPHPWMDYDWLYDQYVEQDKRSYDIAKEFGCKQSTIQYWIYKHQINKEIKNHVRIQPPQYFSYDYLYREHIENGKSLTEIATENGVSEDAIREHMIKNEIPIRHQCRYKYFSEEDTEKIISMYISGASANQISKLYSSSHRTILHLLERNGVKTRTSQEAQFKVLGKSIPDKLTDADYLFNAHWNDGKTCEQIGNELGVDAGTVRRQMHRLGIKTKNDSESKIGLCTGQKHHNWRGGITPLNQLVREYFQTNLAPLVMKRDCYTCQLCGKTHTILHVHHIRKFSTIVGEICSEHSNLDPNIIDDRAQLYDIIIRDQRFLDTDNMITYCKDCHLYRIHKFKRKTISSQASKNTEEGSETIPQGSTSEAIADGSARGLTAQTVI